MIPITADTDLTGRVFSVSGWHFSVGAATGAQVLLRNGSATGTIFASIFIPADAANTNGNSAHFSAARPILFPRGLYVDVVAGTVVGSIQPG